MIGSPCLEQLIVWDDAAPRSGEENMAVDDCLLAYGLDVPVLRLYAWRDPAVSFGYFGRYEEVRALFLNDQEEHLRFVRRSTGGGVVDHRIDVTYTLVLPKECSVAQAKAVQIYQAIHQALAKAFLENGLDAQLVKVAPSGTDTRCFHRPVEWDLVNQSGVKKAGAGQRRTHQGLLHQGSVQGINKQQLRASFPRYLSRSFEEDLIPLEQRAIKEVMEKKYASKTWLTRR